MPVVRTIDEYSGAVQPTAGVRSLPYVASIFLDASSASYFTIVASDTSAYTINAPLNPRAGMRITFDIKNSSGGTMGTITWDAVFKLAGAFTKPANGLRRTIEYYFDGTNWVEVNRAAADI